MHICTSVFTHVGEGKAKEGTRVTLRSPVCHQTLSLHFHCSPSLVSPVAKDCIMVCIHKTCPSRLFHHLQNPAIPLIIANLKNLVVTHCDRVPTVHVDLGHLDTLHACKQIVSENRIGKTSSLIVRKVKKLVDIDASLDSTNGLFVAEPVQHLQSADVLFFKVREKDHRNPKRRPNSSALRL